MLLPNEQGTGLGCEQECGDRGRGGEHTIPEKVTFVGRALLNEQWGGVGHIAGLRQAMITEVTAMLTLLLSGSGKYTICWRDIREKEGQAWGSSEWGMGAAVEGTDLAQDSQGDQ